MKLLIYKGFEASFLERLQERPLLDTDIFSKKNVLCFEKKLYKQLGIAMLSLEEDETAWVTYEEYSLIKSRVDEAIEKEGLEAVIYRNNLFPDYYPIEFEISPELAGEIAGVINGERITEQSGACQKYIEVYNSLVNADGIYYGGFYNYEYNPEARIAIEDYYPQNLAVCDSKDRGDYELFLNNDIDTYLRDLTRIILNKPHVISLKSTDGDIAKRIQKSLQAFCKNAGTVLIKYQEELSEDSSLEAELADIAVNEIGIKDFEGFRSIRFYKNPDINKETVEISQATIIQDIIKQAENAYGGSEKGGTFRDIFITASTGAGKSAIFQTAAVYLARKYNKLTIIIQPIKALMEDQQASLNSSGFTRVERFNSDLITQVEKEAVLRRVKNGEVDLLYLSPETLLSYSIETIIGEREIGLVIVDEAHTVTTWGFGFRPDYWYLGGYLNRLRNQIQTHAGMKRKVYRFPICAFTATAINGGVDDTVGDTIISLYMENPIKYLGYVRRDDIKFDITVSRDTKMLPKAEYEAEKCSMLNKRMEGWLSNDEKTIVYFPYASLAFEASKGIKGFSGIITDKRIGTFIGRNVDELSNEAFKEVKRQNFEAFRNGKKLVIMATKAFGMGIDVKDVKNVYHYAPSGNLSDYIQEIGRAARLKSMEGCAATDFFQKDMHYMRQLFGMSQIRLYQIKKVLEGIYDTYKSKNCARSFLISPESFTYIFNNKKEDACVNQLKTCLLMIEKDFYEKYNFKVLISRPQGVFTKAFVSVNHEWKDRVLNSEYGKYFTFAAKGRQSEVQLNGDTLSDGGDIYSIDLKSIWETFHQNISFPQFKYWFFNSSSHAADRIEIMPSIIGGIKPRQKITVEARKEYLLSEIRERILQDFDFIADTLYAEMGREYFATEVFEKLISKKYGYAQAKIIAHSLFDLVDPDCRCIKRRAGHAGKTEFHLSNGNFKEMLRRPVTKSKIVYRISHTKGSETYTGYVSLTDDEKSTIALKLLSIFNYITYEVVGGEQPEIFIRLNDPDKIRSIVFGNMPYSNSYVTRAKQKHNRDVAVLRRFFSDLSSDGERWDYVENYFLGQDVLEGVDNEDAKTVKMSRSVDKEQSYSTNTYRNWDELEVYFDEPVHFILMKLRDSGLKIPEYLQTTIKKSDEGESILMSWPAKDTLICEQDTSENRLEYFRKKGWHAYRIYEIDYEKIKEELS